MNSDRWQRISSLYHAARALGREERAALLASECRSDPSLRQEVEVLLDVDTRADAFLAAPVEMALAALTPPHGEPAADGLAPGGTIGNYRIDRLLGRGGMGAVFLAYDTRLYRHVALKVVTGPVDDPLIEDRVLREARNAAALAHAGICTIHEVGHAEGIAFIAMEYVAGRSLRHLIEAGALPVSDAVGFGIQAADALAYAHDRGVVHRDFKAANVMIGEDGRLKVVDFGLARRYEAPGVSTSTGSLVPSGIAAGTPYAMAPEQVRGQRVDARTDVWALGVLLYEMVSAAVPFRGATVPDVFTSILTSAPANLPPAVPAALKATIERCLEKDPARRYQHVRGVRGDLTAIQSGTASAWTVWRYHLRRHRRLASAAAALMIATALGALGPAGMWERLSGTPMEAAPIRLAVLPFENLTGDPEQEYLSDGLTEELITQLGRLQPHRLSVIARTSSMQYKNRGVPVDQVGRELGVDYVLEGSARREGSRVRISATLVHARDHTQEWAESFDRELTGILALQHEVARGVAAALAITLLPAEQTRLATAPLVNPEVYEAYSRGQSHARRLTPGDLDRALDYFQLARRRDPNAALPYTGIADVWSRRLQLGIVTPAEATPPMKAALTTALALDETLPQAHLGLAVMYAWTEWNWSAAAPAFQRAIELAPNSGDARAHHADYLYIVGRPAEGTAEMRRALDLDPLSELVQTVYARTLGYTRRFDELEAHARNALQTAPNDAHAWDALATALHLLGRYEESLEAQRQAPDTRNDPEVQRAYTRGYAEGGYRGAQRRAAEVRAARMEARQAAELYVRAGEPDLALHWLERAPDAALPSISAAPMYDGVRRHPGFDALLDRMNLPRRP